MAMQNILLGSSGKWTPGPYAVISPATNAVTYTTARQSGQTFRMRVTLTKEGAVVYTLERNETVLETQTLGKWIDGPVTSANIGRLYKVYVAETIVVNGGGYAVHFPGKSIPLMALGLDDGRSFYIAQGLSTAIINNFSVAFTLAIRDKAQTMNWGDCAFTLTLTCT